MNGLALLQLLAGLALAPLIPGLINRVKALAAGRRGPPTIQLYRDLWKLLRRGVVYGSGTSWVFQAGPRLGLAACLTALAMLPWGTLPALLAFPGDLVVLVYLLGLGRFFTVLAALDTGSSFEGMGASREACLAALAEVPLVLALAALALGTGTAALSQLSLSPIYAKVAQLPPGATAGLLLAGAALLVVYLAENSRIPVDDPNTHLELTMIHEVMILDHSGPELAVLEYAGALKLWLLGGLVAGLPPIAAAGPAWRPAAGFLAAQAVVALLVGVVESVLARIRMNRLPQLMLAAAAFALLALVLFLK
ncbi:MAG: NADH-quinone oxidoreductase subunit H [Lentisphaeria bacterium]